MADEGMLDRQEETTTMAFNTRPLRPIDDGDIEAYARDGAVCLRKVFDPDWLTSLIGPARKICIDKEDVGTLPTMPGRYLARVVPEFRRFVFESPMAEAAGRAMQSSTIRFFFDEFFAKPPKSADKTLWHCDRMGWPASGTMIPSLWIPLQGVAKENCLEVLAGTQHDDVPYWLFSPNARKMIRPPDRAPHPDVEPLRADPTKRFLQWEMEPGDMLVVHPWTLHYSHGNTADDWRIALSVRVFGEDVRWDPRPDCLNIAGASFDEMIPGEAPGGPVFPLLWSADGARDGDGNYPRGFATTWTQKRQSGINDYDGFKRLQDKLTAEVQAAE
jgi:hypothetical protein